MKKFRHYLQLYPLAVERFDLSDFDLIISSSSGYAKGVRKKRGAVHVCYCHTPMRWVWRYKDYAARERFSPATRKLLPVFLAGLQHWDMRASKQPDYYIVNSRIVAERVRKIYGREALVIPPPIDVSRFSINEPDEDYYLNPSPFDLLQTSGSGDRGLQKTRSPSDRYRRWTRPQTARKISRKEDRILGQTIR